MVEVEVGDDVRVDLIHINARADDLGFNGPPVEPEDGAHLLVELVARARLDDISTDPARFRVGLGGFEEQAVVHQAHAVLVVGGDGSFPDDAGDDAEHAAAVEEELGSTEKGPFVLH